MAVTQDPLNVKREFERPLRAESTPAWSLAKENPVMSGCSRSWSVLVSISEGIQCSKSRWIR
ncbi:hypothetical protein CY34DRAFT_806270 [Suillus luteus UH-Slu-Lm8-n1]|uniref:Uncharacterized protein n=1 Tax=Suillus luteus UH-Slu-Lm8-n1 TaxID=930992 RepID=A0A0C9ZTP7_9AGAM|nr:hypothetical protein CY34DRAFT_806270 [Suillus luteus UH-Slu-Lm8-n1]